MSKDNTQSCNNQQLSENNLNFSVCDNSSLHKCRTEIPNIVFDIGLTCYEMGLYCHLKRIAGDSGKCWYTVPQLAKITGMSTRQLQKCKNSLSSPHPKLDNLPLIRIEKRKKPNSDENDSDVITITDLWPLNFQKFYGGAPYAPGGGAPYAPGGAPYAPIRRTKKEEPIKERSSAKQSFASSPENIKITVKQLKTLEEKVGAETAKEAIDYLSKYKTRTGKKTTSDYMAILKWVLTAVHNEKQNITNKKGNIEKNLKGLMEINEFLSRKNKRGDLRWNEQTLLVQDLVLNKSAQLDSSNLLRMVAAWYGEVWEDADGN